MYTLQERQASLERAKEIWVDAALKDYRQFHVGGDSTGTTPCPSGCVEEHCLLTILYSLHVRGLRFTCAEHPGAHYLPHFNNSGKGEHGWDWLTAARKLGTPPYELAEP